MFHFFESECIPPMNGNVLLVCTEMALIAESFSTLTNLIKKAQNLLKPLSAIFVQICCYT
jgi:hypothetical protein